MSLKAFLKENVETAKPVEVVISKRFKDENGQPVPWVVGCISTQENSALRKECTKVTQKGKKSQAEFDFPEYQTRFLTRCVQFPDLNAVELQNSFGVMCAEELLHVMLLPGEFDDLYQAANAVNGFDTSFEEQVDEAKN